MLAGIEVGRERGEAEFYHHFNLCNICYGISSIDIRMHGIHKPRETWYIETSNPISWPNGGSFGMCIVESTIERDDGMPDWTFKHFNLSAYTFLFEMQIPIGDRSYCSKQLDTFRLQQLCNH